MRTQLVTRFLALAVIALLAGGAARMQAQPPPSADKLVLLALLKAGSFESLNDHLSTYQTEFEAGTTNDRDVVTAFDSFSSTDPQLVELLDQWVEQFPNSYVPWLARASHRLHMAYVARGGSYASRTHPEAMRGMRGFANAALADAARAIELNPKLTGAYLIRIYVAQLQGADHAGRKAFEDGLAHMPSSSVIRYARLSALMPWWGGSIEEIQALVRETRAAFPQEESYIWLDGYGDYVKAQSLRHKRRYPEAITVFDRALGYGEAVSYRYGRAQVLYFGELDDWGLKDVTRAVELMPQWVTALSLKAQILIELGHFEQAQSVRDLIFQLDPYNPDLLFDMAMSYERKNQFAEALADLERAELHGKYDARIYFRRAMMKMYNVYPFDDRHTAKGDFEKAIELQPENTTYWLNYAGFLNGPYARREWMCGSTKAFKVYLELCERNGRCRPASVQSVKRDLEIMSKMKQYQCAE